MTIATATKQRRMSSEDALALWTEYRRTNDKAAARPPGPDLRPAGEVHRLQEGPRDAGPLRGRGLHLLRPRGADPVDRPLRPGQGRDARAVRLDPHPRRRARRAAPPGLGPPLRPPLGARHRARRREPSPRCTAAAPSTEELAESMGVEVSRAAPPPRRGHAVRPHLAQHARPLRRRDDDRAHGHHRLQGRDRRPAARRGQGGGQGQVPRRLRPPAPARARGRRPALRQEHDAGARSARSSASPSPASARSTASSSARCARRSTPTSSSSRPSPSGGGRDAAPAGGARHLRLTHHISPW